MITEKTKVLILMGSASDLEIMNTCKEVLDRFGVVAAMHIHSAHRTPEQTVSLVREAESKSVSVFIAAAGVAAHLAGVVAAHTICPVIGVPMSGGALNGLDALLSTVQMPKGTPVGTVAIGSAGAVNAALLAVRILSLSDESLRKRLVEYQQNICDEVLSADAKLQARLGPQ